MSNQEKFDQLSKKQLIKMADLMSDAFITHENWTYLIPNQNKRKKALYHIFLLIYKVINRYGYIFEVDSDGDTIGYITFMDSKDKAQISLYRVLRTGSLLSFFKFLFVLKYNELKGIFQYMNVYNQYHKHDTKGFIHLYMVGIKAKYQGQGYMSNAFKQCTNILKDEGFTDVMLETSDSTNIPIYKTMGFTLKEFMSSKSKKQTIYFFEREL